MNKNEVVSNIIKLLYFIFLVYFFIFNDTLGYANKMFFNPYRSILDIIYGSAIYLIVLSSVFALVFVSIKLIKVIFYK